MVQRHSGKVSPYMKETAPMLARRFTIVCLLITIFGMGLSILVAEKSRSGRSHGVVYQFCDTSLTGCAGGLRR
jgi:hypothetical protein